MGATVTSFATLLVVTYLLPLAYGFITSLKSEAQMSDPRQLILPQSPRTVVIDGEEVPVLDVPIDGETQRPRPRRPRPRVERVRRSRRTRTC